MKAKAVWSGGSFIHGDGPFLLILRSRRSTEAPVSLHYCHVDPAHQTVVLNLEPHELFHVLCDTDLLRTATMQDGVRFAVIPPDQIQAEMHKAGGSTSGDTTPPKSSVTRRPGLPALRAEGSPGSLKRLQDLIDVKRKVSSVVETLPGHSIPAANGIRNVEDSRFATL